MRNYLTGLVAISALSLGGCAVAAVGAVGAAGVATFQERSVGTAFDDSSAAGEIKSKLLARGGYGGVDVEVVDGLVLLSGRVITPEMRVKAADIAWSSKRTQDVANEIQIEPSGGFRASASDQWISTRVRTSLIANTRVRRINFHVETYDNVVYLMGIARSQAELERVTGIASRVGGVEEVVSYIKIREGGDLTPAVPLEPASVEQAISPLPPVGAEDELAGGAY
ncbi:MAG: BON domain-containing protein [Hyphomonadaceae bacterium]